jgi:hypothetical protein
MESQRDPLERCPINSFSKNEVKHESDKPYIIALNVAIEKSAQAKMENIEGCASPTNEKWLKHSYGVEDRSIERLFVKEPD